VKILGAKRFRTGLLRGGEQSGAQGSAHGQANHDEGDNGQNKTRKGTESDVAPLTRKRTIGAKRNNMIKSWSET
jgi:hypothetical protein